MKRGLITWLKGLVTRRSLSLPEFIPFILSSNLPKTLARLPREDREQARIAFLELLAAEILKIGGVIGSEMPHLVPGILRQYSTPEECKKFMMGLRASATRLLEAIDAKGDQTAGLDRFASHLWRRLSSDSLTRRPEEAKQEFVHGLSVTECRNLPVLFLFGCVLAYEHSQVFWDLTRRDVEGELNSSPVLFSISMSFVYGQVLDEEDEELFDAACANPDKWLSFLSKIAQELVASYERDFGSIEKGESL